MFLIFKMTKQVNNTKKIQPNDKMRISDSNRKNISTIIVCLERKLIYNIIWMKHNITSYLYVNYALLNIT